MLSHSFEYGPIAGLLPKHFYSDANRRIYEVVTELALRKEPLDVIAITRELRKDDRLRQVGGVSYLALLAYSIPATAYAESHALAIRELYRRRVLSDAALRLRVELRAGAVDSGQAWVRFKALCDEMSNA